MLQEPVCAWLGEQQSKHAAAANEKIGCSALCQHCSVTEHASAASVAPPSLPLLEQTQLYATATATSYFLHHLVFLHHLLQHSC
jgi:hypothetical protein